MNMYGAKLRGAILLGFSLLCVMLSACDDRSHLPRLSDDAVILAFGDSLTYGTGTSRDLSYPARLQQLTGRQVINAGVPGEISRNGLKRLPGLLDRHQPELLILCHGGNDILRRMDRQQMKQNLIAMIELAQSRGIAVVLVAIPDFGIFLQPADAYAEIAEQLHVPIEEDALSEILKNSSLKSDQVHPNSQGYQVLAETIEKLLRATKAL